MTPAHRRSKDEASTTVPGHTLTGPEGGIYSGLVSRYQTFLQSEPAWHAGEELYRALVNSPAVGVAMLTHEARFVQANKTFCSMTGYPAAEILTLDCAALIHPEDWVHMREQIAQLLSGEVASFVTEARYFRKTGEMLWIQHNISLARDAENRPANLIALCQDITERKQSEEALRASQAQLAAELADTRLLRDISAQLIEPGDEQALYEKIVDAVVAIMRSDCATMQMLYPERGPKGELCLLASRGLTPEGQKVWEWVRIDTDSTCGQALRTGKRAIAQNVETSDFLADTPGGAALLDEGIHAAQSTPLFSRGGRFLGMISSHWFRPHVPTDRDLRLLDILARQAADIIERKRAEDELRRVNRDLEQFAYSASHDLQEPLRTIKIYSQLLPVRYGKDLDGDSAEYLGFLRSAATRMEMLVRDLLAYTQLNNDVGPAEKTEAGKALGEALANLAPAIAEGGAKISFDPLPAVRVNETHLGQLFQNLVGNAVKYRDPARPCAIQIGAELQDGVWVFSVRDNGIGIEDRYRQHIFGLFKRLDATDSHSGTGIGLAICQRIVERYHGRIWVESEPGKGSDFRFTLPV